MTDRDVADARAVAPRCWRTTPRSRWPFTLADDGTHTATLTVHPVRAVATLSAALSHR